MHLKVHVNILKNGSLSSQYIVCISIPNVILGPAVCLFEKDYYERVKDALRPGGIHCAQGEAGREGGKKRGSEGGKERGVREWIMAWLTGDGGLVEHSFSLFPAND